jgi:hypothetical protein
VRDVLRALVAVSMGPRAIRGRAVAYSVLAYMARCSRATVARAVAFLERRGLIRRGRTVEDARGGWGYDWQVDEAQLAALQTRETYATYAARQRARRAAARPSSGCVTGNPCNNPVHTDSSAEPINPPPTPRAALDAADPFAADPFAAGPLDSQLAALDDEALVEPPRAAWSDAPSDASPAKGWASRAVAGAADAARAIVDSFKRSPAPAPTSTPPSTPPEKPKSNETAIVERIVVAHGGRHRDEVEQLVTTHGAALVAAAWTYGEQNARYQPPRPAYLRAWLANPANTSPSSTTSRPSTSPPTPYSAAHGTFPARELRRPETDEERAANLAALDLVDALLR